MKNKIGLVIPCFKENGNIRKLVNKILFLLDKFKDDFNYRIYLVNDCCPNDSWKEVKKNKKITIIHHSKNLGVGGASISGFKAAIKEQCDAIIKMDGDGQHNPNYLAELIPYLLGLDRTKLVMIKGSRYIWPELSKDAPNSRKIGSLLIEPMLRSSLNYRGLTDVANGFLAMNNFTLNFLLISNLGTRLRKRYLFECSLLEKCSVIDVEIHEFGMVAFYSENWKSSMQSSMMIFPILTFCFRSIFRRIIYSYLLKFNLGSILLLIAITNLVLASTLYFQKISLDVALGITVSSGISNLFTSSLTIFVLSFCIFLLYDYTSGSKVKKIMFKTLLHEVLK